MSIWPGDGPKTFTEWRVTGWSGIKGDPPYEFVWSEEINAHLGDPEQAAKSFVAMLLDPDRPLLRKWTEGPHLAKRTVVVAEWAPVDLGESQ